MSEGATKKYLSSAHEYYTSGMEIITQNPKYYFLASIIEMIVLVLILYKWSPFGISTANPAASALLVIMFGFIQLSMYFFVKEKVYLTNTGSNININPSDVVIKIILTLLTLIGTVLLLYAIFKYGSSTLLFLFHSTIYIVIILVALALLYLITKPVVDAAKDTKGRASILKLIGQLIMYTPCLLLDIIDWFRYQYKITTKPIWILLGIEALLISLQILVPKLISWIANRQGKILLSEPVYLDKEHTIGTYDTLYGDSDKKKYKYSISFWFWINPQPPNTGSAYTKYTNILEFGKKPAIEYNALENTLRVSCNIHNKDNSIIYETNNIKYQTWNNIVINYDAGTMDVFLNGELVGSQPGIAPYMSYENIVAGKDNGIQGGIANVIYRDNIMQLRDIEYLYKAMKSLQVPII